MDSCKCSFGLLFFFFSIFSQTQVQILRFLEKKNDFWFYFGFLSIVVLLDFLMMPFMEIQLRATEIKI